MDRVVTHKNLHVVAFWKKKKQNYFSNTAIQFRDSDAVEVSLWTDVRTDESDVNLY